MTTDTPAMDPEKLFYPSEEQGATTPEEDVKEPEEVEVEEDETAENGDADQDENDESEGVEEVEDPEVQEESDDNTYVDIEGREITVSTIKEWEKGSLRQSDYTKKTQALARDREEFESSKGQQVSSLVKERVEALDSSIEQIEALIASDPVDMDELETYDPEEFIKQQKIQNKRKDALTKAKAEKQKAVEDRNTESTKILQAQLIASHPEWLDDKGKQTDIYVAELKNLGEYFAKNEWTEQDQADIKSPKVWEAVFIAAKENRSKEKAKTNKAKLKKLPLTSRPGKSVKKQAPKSDAELFYGSK